MEVSRASEQFRHRAEDLSFDRAALLHVFSSPSCFFFALCDSSGRELLLEEYHFPVSQGIESNLIHLQRLSTLEVKWSEVNIRLSSAWGPLMVFPENDFDEADLPALWRAEMRENRETAFVIGPRSGLEFRWAVSLPESIQETLAAFESNGEIEYLPASFHGMNLVFDSQATSGILHCTLFPGGMDVWLVRHGKLQLTNRFFCDRVDDFIYHLMNCGQQAGWSPKEDRLLLCGTDKHRKEVEVQLDLYVADLHIEEAEDALAERMQLLRK